MVTAAARFVRTDFNMATGGADVSNTHKIVIVTDSRGTTLDIHFTASMLEFIDIRHYNGLTLHILNERLPKLHYIKEATMVYFMLGVNDFTVLDHCTHKVRLVTPFVSGLIVKLKNELQNLVSNMKHLYPTTAYIICPIYGLDINKYNKLPGQYKYQSSVDQAIVRVNIFIGKLNTSNNQLCPFLSNVIHRFRPKAGTYITLYDRLWDGLHPNKETQRKIVGYLQRAIHRLQAVKGK